MVRIGFLSSLVIGLVLSPVAAPAVETGPPSDKITLDEYGSVSGAGQYRRCLGLLNVDPDEAYDMARQWRTQGGGPAARHCEALALIALGHYDTGALKLRSLSNDPKVGPELRVEILGQSANAWLLEGAGERALIDLELALAFVEDTDMTPAHLLYDRARAYVLLGEWQDAVNDLTVAIGRQARFLNAFVLRATARRMLGDAEGALEDVQTALELHPNHAGALLERGLLRADQGKRNDALVDLANAMVYGKDNEVAQAAKKKMEELGFTQ